MTDHSILRQVDHIQKAVDQLVRDLNRPRWECPEPVTSTPLLFEGAPSDAWLQSTTHWPRLLSERVANNVDVFETEEYKDKYRPGEIVNVYRAACPGMRRTALLLHVPQFKVGSCVSGGLDSRMYQIKKEQYGAAWFSDHGYVIDSDFSDWFPSLLETRMNPSMGSPVTLNNRAYSIVLPSDMSLAEFEVKLQEVMLPAQMFSWLESADGIRHCQSFGVAPEVGKRSTAYNRGDRTKLSPATEIYCFRRQSDPDRLLCALEKIISDHVLGVNRG